MYEIIRQILKVGIKSEPPPVVDFDLQQVSNQLQEHVLRIFDGALTIRHVDA